MSKIKEKENECILGHYFGSYVTGTLIRIYHTLRRYIPDNSNLLSAARISNLSRILMLIICWNLTLNKILKINCKILNTRVKERLGGFLKYYLAAFIFSI